MIDGSSVTIEQILGESGQGAVSLVKIQDGSNKVLKWYTNSYIGSNDRFYDNIKTLSNTLILLSVSKIDAPLRNVY